jgi:ribosomal protein S6--L-glutamate ligase
MNILIVHGKDVDRNIEDLQKEAEELGHNVTLVSAIDLSGYVDEKGSTFYAKGDELDRQDLVLLRGLGRGTCERITKRIGVLTQMELSGVKVINPVGPLLNARNKFVTMCNLARASICVPSTFMTESAMQAYKAARMMKQIVYKPIIGSMGYGSLKFEDADLAYNAFQSLEMIGRPIMVQEYIPSANKDTRVFVIGQRVAAAMTREAPAGRWKSNVSQGAKTTSTEPSGELSELAIKATRTLGLEYSGVDVAEVPNQGYCILEVNASPSWQALKQTTPVNIARELLQHALQKR